MQYIDEEGWRITGRQLKLVYLVKILSNHYVTLGPENFEYTNNFGDWCVTLNAYTKC